MKNSNWLCGPALLVALGWAGSAPAAGQGTSAVPRVAMPPMKHVPAIDGRIGEEEWRDAVRNVGLVSHRTGSLTAREAVFLVGCDGERLYVALKTEVAPDGRVLTRAVPDEKRDVVAAFLDDSFELVVDPNRARGAGQRRYYHLIANGRGALYDWAIDPDDPPNPRDLNWRLPDWELKEQVHDGFWHVEMAIPLEALGTTADELSRPWGLRIARNWRRPGEQSQWGAGVTSYDEQPTMPQIVIDPAAPVVRVMSLHRDHKEPRIEVAVVNPQEDPVKVRVQLSDAWHRDPPQRLDEQAVIGPGGERSFVLEGRDGGPEGLHETLIQVTGPDEQQVFYGRRVRWSLHRPDQPWAIGEEQRRAVDLKLNFYPYHGKIAYRVDIEALALRDNVTAGSAALWQADDEGRPTGEPLWQKPVRFSAYLAEGVEAIPELGEGKYVFGVTLEGEGLSREPAVQPFVREVFPWEHNNLGVSDEVMPPFEPLEVENNAVRAVLREHRHTPAGLWEQVASRGEPLLAAPARWEVVAAEGGKDPEACKVEGTGWRLIERKPTEVRGEAGFSAGPVRAKVTAEYDYDGMMLVRLALEPTGEAAVHRLSLVVPLEDAKARYMHAVGDGLRHNYAGFTPEGTGRVWDSNRANKLEIVGTFFPYLWLGDGERGICWFADSDRDWVLDEETPTIELVREGDVLAMRVNLVTRPGPLTRRREIVFGLQATPSKPMPEGWRRWTGIRPIEGGRPVRWMGACLYWGGLFYDVYPFERRLDFFDKLGEARQTQEADREFIDRWMALVDEKIAPQGTPRYDSLKAHVNAGFHVASSSPVADGYRLIPYTNARGVGFHVPEFATFQDEWLRYRWFHRNWGKEKNLGYDVDPGRSFQDYAVWYYREMLRCFDGVYWDNTFLSANFDPVAGRAWTDEQGRVHPTMGLLNLRQLIKRTAIMLWQETRDRPPERLPPITLAHMTNTTIVPVLSFANCTMDWEWKYGYDDFQDRFSPDATVAETIGRQVGAWPTILAGGHPKPDDPRVDFMYRTRLGVALVHEIAVFDYRPARDVEIYGKLFEFGYGTDACRVFNYWQPGHPVEVEGVDARTLAIACGGRAIAVVTDYGGGGDCRVKLDLAKLGLKPEAAAVDLENDKPIERTAPGSFRFPLGKHDFRILRVE